MNDQEAHQPLKPLLNYEPKRQVEDDTPMRIGALDFGVMPESEIEKQAHLEVSDRNLYDLGTERNPTKNGPLDRRLGITTKMHLCETCGQEQRNCNGHWGYVRLEAACYHIGFLPFTIDILNQICKTCSRILLNEKDRRAALKTLRRPNMDSFQRRKLLKRIQTDCRKVRGCPHCGGSNGPVRKVVGHACKLVHLQFEFYNKSTAKSKKAPPDKMRFDLSLEKFSKDNQDMARHTKKAVDDLPAVKVHRLFCNIPTEDCEILGLDLNKGRPESYLWTYLPVPPPNIRPSVPGDQGTTEDELTTKLSEIIDLNTRLRTARSSEEHMSIQMDYYEKLQDHIAMYINSHAPGLNKTEYGKAIRSFCSRLKGKQGRFRGNLSGKRVNFSGRTVISPDPNLSVEEVGIPIHVAKILSYPETVTNHNLKRLRDMVRNGPDIHPGVNLIRKKSGRNISMRVMESIGPKMVQATISQLEVGDVVIRHLIDGDYVLFNRQPSLHKLSILCHKTKIQPGRTFRFNESVCNPYNADFDGDEMNIHVPQTEEARTEARELMGVKHNLVTPKNGTPIIAPIQDFITAAYLLSLKDVFFNRAQFSQIIGWMFDATTFEDPDTGEMQSYEIPPPTIYKPMYLWTGKQVFNVLMRPSKKCKVLINLEDKLRQFKPVANQAPDLSEDDSYLVIRNSEVMCGVMDKSAIGDGKKSSVFFVMLRDYGEDYAVQGMNRLAKVSSRWLSQQGFSIGIGDVYPSINLETKKGELMDVAFEKCQDLISSFKAGKLSRDPGCNEEQTLENKISRILSAVRQDAGAVCFVELSKHNAAVIMAKSGAKGSMLNVSQMTAGVGQQMIDGRRVDNGFQDRTLPHFPKGARDPISKGFVRNSFFSGLTPTEFIFHAMSGREGLVDTAVKTAETGYMSRRLIKSLEDAFIVYDNTVRNSTGNVIQFSFGDDSLDPAELEGNGVPINFDRTFCHAIETTREPNSERLEPAEIKQRSLALLEAQGSDYTQETLPPEFWLDRKDEENVDISFEIGAGDSEAKRPFHRDILKFLRSKVLLLEKLRTKHRLIPRVKVVKPGQHWRPRAGERALIAWSNAKEITVEQNETTVDNVLKITAEALDEFFRLCFTKYEKSRVQPGHAVGAIGAQSIGEPGTQMTLKTFHFAGIAGMSITAGVPRIKEIINAAKKISTPVITCVLENKRSEQAAQYVKGRIEKTYLHEIAEFIEDIWSKDKGYIKVRIDVERVSKLQLDLSTDDIANAICKTKGLRLSRKNVYARGNSIRIIPDEPDMAEFDEMDVDGGMSDIEEELHQKAKGRRKKRAQLYFLLLQETKRNLLSVVVKGYPETARAVISRADKDDEKAEVSKGDLSLLVEGYGLKACMSTEGVNGRKTWTNGVMETCEVLGIEAARSCIISEIHTVMGSMDIDLHHIYLLACIMTLKGEVLGITRFGMAKMRNSVLQLASFEKTPDHLFEAATKMKSDPISGVSESIIMGQSVKLGTGAAGVIRPLYITDDDLAVKEPLFQTSFRHGRVGTGWSSDAWSSDAEMVEATA